MGGFGWVGWGFFCVCVCRGFFGVLDSLLNVLYNVKDTERAFLTPFPLAIIYHRIGDVCEL